MTQHLAFTMSNEIISLVVLQIVVVLGMIIKAWVDGYNRIQDRLDRESTARIAHQEMADVKAKGAERERRIIKKIDENTAVNEIALNAANGLKAEIAASTKLVEETVTKLAGK